MFTDCWCDLDFYLIICSIILPKVKKYLMVNYFYLGAPNGFNLQNIMNFSYRGTIYYAATTLSEQLYFYMKII